MNLFHGFFEKRKQSAIPPKSTPSVKTETKREFNKTPEDLQFFLADAFKMAGQQLFPPHQFIQVDNQYPGNYMEFSMRLKIEIPSPMTPAKILPYDGSNLTEAANYLILGSIQMHEGQCRINMRIVRVETGEILVTGKGTGSCDADGVKAAAHAALYGISRGA
jgi:hypothetical protein